MKARNSLYVSADILTEHDYMTKLQPFWMRKMGVNENLHLQPSPVETEYAHITIGSL